MIPMTVPKGDHFRSGGAGDGAGEGAGVLAFAAAFIIDVAPTNAIMGPPVTSRQFAGHTSSGLAGGVGLSGWSVMSAL
jgi:hypothetical protein